MAKDLFYSGQRDRNGRRRLFLVTVLVLAIFALDIFTGGLVRTIVQKTGAVIWSGAESAAGAAFGSGYFSSRASLAQENALLREQLEESALKSAAFAALQEENTHLRALLNLPKTDVGTSAAIVSSARASPYGTFMVSVGEREGVRAGDIVLSEGGFVLGTVEEVRAHTSLVREIFAALREIDVVARNAETLSTGRGNGNAVLTLPRAVAVQEGDAVIGKSLGSRPVGIVGKIESDSSSATQTVYVHLPLNLGTIRYVKIVPGQ